MQVREVGLGHTTETGNLHTDIGLLRMLVVAYFLWYHVFYVPHSLELHQPLWRTTFIAMIKFWIKWSNVHKFTVLVNYANLWIHFSKWWYPYIRYSASITTGYWIIMVCNCQLMPAILSMWNHLPFQQVPSNPPPYLCSISGPNSMRKWQCIII